MDTTIDERRRDLDRFANASSNGDPSTVSLAPSVRPLATPLDRVFGAQQVAVYRDEARVLQKLKTLAAAAGSDWFYRYPVKNRRENRTDWIEGASIKLANDVARIYGNCDVDTRVIDLGDNWLIYARFTDFETGYSLTRPFQQRKSQKAIQTDNDRQLDIAFQIGVSKAIRNVVVNALQTYADFAFDEARNSLVTKIGSDLPEWRQRTIEGLGRIPVDVTRVEKVVGRAAKDWLAPDVARVIAMMKAIADGMATVDETFPPLDAASDKPEDEPKSPSPSPQEHSEESATAASQPASGAADAVHPQAHPPEAGAASSAKEPASEREYIAYAEGWIGRLVDPTAGEAQWKTEKKIRNSANISPEVRDDLEGKLKAKVAQLRASRNS